MRRAVTGSRLVVVVAAVAVLGGCSSAEDVDDVSAAPTPNEEAADTGADDESATADDDAAADDDATDDDILPGQEPGVLVQFRGDQILGGPDVDGASAWACAVFGDGEEISFQFFTADGDDISVSYQADGVTNATLTLADGTNWNATEGGVANASQQGEDTYRMSIQLTETDTGESESMDARLTCS